MGRPASRLLVFSALCAAAAVGRAGAPPAGPGRESVLVLDFSGRPGNPGPEGFDGEAGGDAPDVLLSLRAVAGLGRLRVRAEPEGRPAEAVVYDLRLPLEAVIELYASGGDGGKGGGGVCRPDWYELLAGRGGDGGNGGDVTVVYDDPRLLDAVKVRNRGGFGGSDGFSCDPARRPPRGGLNGLDGKVVLVGKPPIRPSTQPR